MFRRYLSLTLIILVINLACGAAIFASNSNEEKEAAFVEKVKTAIAKIGTGTEARIEIKLKDGTKIKGFVTEIKPGSFVVMNDKTAAPTEVPYSQARQVKGHHVSTGFKILTVGLIVGLIVIVVIAGRH